MTLTRAEAEQIAKEALEQGWEGDKHMVGRRAQRSSCDRGGAVSTRPSLDQALADLRRCATAFGQTPSRRDYDRWRIREGNGALSASVVQKLGGGWLRALKLADLIPTSAVVVATRQRFTSGEVEQAVRDCVAEKGWPLREHDFILWARAQPAEARVPTSTATIIRACGSWRALCERAGYTLPRIEPIAALQRAAEDLGGVKAAIQYDHWRRGQPEEIRSLLPGSMTIRAQCGSWPDALQAAGLIGTEDVEFLTNRKGKWVTDEEILDDLSEAIERHGRVLTAYRYQCYRVRVKHETGRIMVAAQTAITRFGSWELAKAAASS